jgi:hypothetical protein
MNEKISQADFLNLLLASLPGSSGADRKLWARLIVENNFDIEVLSVCLDQEYKIASRFLWLLSDIGEYNGAFLGKYISFLFEKSQSGTSLNFDTSFAKYWFLAGIPEEHEGIATDLLFKWLNAPDINVSIKFHVLNALFELCQKYPELKEELTASIEDQLTKNKLSFDKKATTILTKIAAS